jgi:hypothetical protein
VFFVLNGIFEAIPAGQVELPYILIHFFDRPMGRHVSFWVAAKCLPDGVLIFFAKAVDDSKTVFFYAPAVS